MKKKTVGGIAALALAASLAMPVGLAVADDGVAPLSNLDSSYNFTFSGQGATQGTSGRTKDTSTASYIKIANKWGADCRVYIDGAMTSAGTWYDRTNSPAYATHTGEFEIHNTVYEAGYKWARLTGWAYAGYGHIDGVWSPDCAGSYPDLNNQ